MNQLISNNKQAILCLLLLFFIVLFYQLFDIGCIIRELTGFPCPVCGMTRAWLAVIQLDISKAFYYHPLFLLGPVLVYQIVFYNNMRSKDKVIILTGIIFFVTYIIRLLFFIIP